MSELSDAQARFAWMLGELLQWVNHHQRVPTMTLKSGATRVRLSWVYRDEQANARVGGHPRSLHVQRLACDLFLDQWDGSKWIYQERTEAYQELGERWEAMGGAWGGPWDDGGHFSLAYGGMR